MSRWVYIDCETMPSHKPVDISKVQANRTYKDPEKIREDKLRKAYTAWMNTAKELHSARVFIIGAAVDNGEIATVINASEEHVIKAFAAWLDEHAPMPQHPSEPPPVLVAYNGVGFDYKLLALRAVKYGMPELARRLKPTNSRYGDSTRRDPFVDLGHTGSLHDWADLFSIKYTPDPDWLYDEWDRPGRNEFVHAKCREDVSVLRQLTEKLRSGGLM